MIFAIIFFFIMSIGLGIGAITLLKLQFKNPLEKILMSIGLGLGIFPILAVTLNLFRVPLHWITFFILGIAGFTLPLCRNKFKFPKIEFKLTKSNLFIIAAIVLSAIFLFVYVKGAYSYPYLEDDDPWGHVIGATYIAEHNTYSRYLDEPVTDENFFRTYMEPYPPAYDTLMGIIHQINDSIIDVLKFFNALIIALGIIFFYFFAEVFSQNRKKALIATFVITILPCFMSHFIWAQTLSLVLFFPAFYCAEKIKEDKKWAVLLILIIASIFVTQPSSSAFFTAMFGIYWFSKIVISYFDKKELKRVFTKENNIILFSLFAGIGLSMVYWIPTLIRYGLKHTLRGIGITVGLFGAGNVDTSGGFVYGIRDYMIAPLASKMDQPIGLGIFVFFLVLFSVFLLVVNYKRLKTNHYLLTILLWLVFTFIGTEGNALPFKLFPHRFWAFFAIPIAFFAAEGIIALLKSLKDPAVRYSVLSIIFIGMLWTSAYPKYVVETSMWPPGATWSSGEELQGYMAFGSTVPKGTRVFNICSHEGKLLAFGPYTPPYHVEQSLFRRQIGNKTMEDIYSLAKKENFDYVVVDGYCVRRMSANQTEGLEKTNNLLLKMFNSTKFRLTYSTNAFWSFKVV